MKPATPISRKSKLAKQGAGDCPLLIQGLSRNQVVAMNLVAEWESETPDEFCRKAILAFVESSFDDMRAIALRRPVTNQTEKEWADTFFEPVEKVLGISKLEKARTRKAWQSSNAMTVKRLKTEIQTPIQDACRRYWKGPEFNGQLFTEETILLMSTRRYGPYEGLHRDAAGHLFIRTAIDAQYRLKQVTYKEACTWLAGSGQQRPPEALLALFGITGDENTQKKGVVE